MSQPSVRLSPYADYRIIHPIVPHSAFFCKGIFRQAEGRLFRSTQRFFCGKRRFLFPDVDKTGPRIAREEIDLSQQLKYNTNSILI